LFALRGDRTEYRPVLFFSNEIYMKEYRDYLLCIYK